MGMKNAFKWVQVSHVLVQWPDPRILRKYGYISTSEASVLSNIDHFREVIDLKAVV